MFFFFICNSKNDFIFVKESEKVILKIDNGKKYLEWNKKSILNLKTENIDLKTLRIGTPGMTFKKEGKRKDELNLEITPTRKLFKKGTVNFKFVYKSHDETCIAHLFVIHIK